LCIKKRGEIIENAVLIDYLKYTFSFESIEKTINYNSPNIREEYLEHKFISHLINILGYSENEITVYEFGRSRFQWRVSLGEEVDLLFDGSNNKEGNKTHMLEMTGSACKEFTKRNGNWFQLLDYLFSSGGGGFTRIDIAIDIINNDRLTLNWFKTKCDNRDLVTKFNSWRFFESGRFSDSDSTNTSKTIYFGTPNSHRQLTIYDKLKERQAKNEHYSLNHWVRIETRFQKDQADEVVADLLNGEIYNLGDYYKSILSSLVEFKNHGVDLSRKNDWTIARPWERLLGSVSKYQFKNTYENESSSIKAKKKWIKKNVSNSFLNVLGSNDIDRIGDVLVELLDNKIYSTTNKDLSMVNKERIEQGLEPYKDLEDYQKSLLLIRDRLYETNDYSKIDPNESDLPF